MNNEPRVFIVQKPLKVIKDNHDKVIATVPLFDLTPAMKYGEIISLIEPGEVALMPFRAVKRLKEKLCDFCDNDYIVPAGDPVLIGIAIAIAAAKNGGKINVLRWDKFERAYTSLQYDIGIY